ncbi:MAG: CdaR family protein [Ignavibacteriaceae bacterium]|jgi:YbbR domain-containing protein|nr:CdaR family protein [Ignavibacteriaceae bacterium]
MSKKIITISFIVFFSLALWVSVSLSNEYYTTITVPIVFTDLPEDYIVGSSSAKEVRIGLKGEGWLLTKLFTGKLPIFEITLNKSSSIKNLSIRNFIENNSWITSRMQVVDINPSQLTIDIDRVFIKKVPIKPRTKLSFNEGYGIASKVFIDPESVSVYGTMSNIRKIDSVETYEKEFKNIDEKVGSSLTLKPIPDVYYKRDNTLVYFDVQKTSDKTFKDVDVEIINVPRGREIVLYPSKISLTFRGGMLNLGKLNKDAIRVYVDYWKAIKDTSGTIEPIVEHPNNIELLNTEPNSLKYIIKEY